MTDRTKQIGTIGKAWRSELMPAGLLDLSLEGLAELYIGYEDKLEEGVKRRIKIVDSGEDWIEIEVRLTPGLRGQEPEHHYRLTLKLEELET